MGALSIPNMLPLWYCTIDGGASAFSVFAATREDAWSAARQHIIRWIDVTDDARLIELVRAPILVLTPREWDRIQHETRTPGAFITRARALQHLAHESRPESAACR
jgi:hypothetical protein